MRPTGAGGSKPAPKKKPTQAGLMRMNKKEKATSYETYRRTNLPGSKKTANDTSSTRSRRAK